MSQVKFKAMYKDKPVEIMAGWDRPMSHYYMTLFDLSEDAKEETVWSTLDHRDERDGTGTERLDAQLAIMGIEVPEGFWDKVKLNEGNKVYNYAYGRWVAR